MSEKAFRRDEDSGATGMDFERYVQVFLLGHWSLRGHQSSFGSLHAGLCGSNKLSKGANFTFRQKSRDLERRF